MKKIIPIIFIVLFVLTILLPNTATTQSDPGLVRWVQQLDGMVRTNRQLVDHEQKRRVELDNQLRQTLQRDMHNTRQHIQSLQTQINQMHNRLYSMEQAIKKLIR